jgi:hypothetical protein
MIEDNGGYGDAGYFAQRTPNTIYMTMGWDGEVHANYASYEPGSGVPTIYVGVSDLTKPGGLSVNDLLHGYDLIGVLKKYKGGLK